MKILNKFISAAISFSLATPYSLVHASEMQTQMPSQAQSQTQKIREIMKSLDYKSGKSVMEWVSQNPGKFHTKIRNMLDRYQMLYLDQKLPKVDVQEIKSNTKEITRFVMSDSSGQIVIDLYQKNGKVIANLGGQEFDYDNVYYDHYANSEDINPMLTLEQLEQIYKVNPKYAAYYQAQFRTFIDALTQVSETFNSPAKKSKYSYVDLILEYAYATEANKKCVIAGYLSLLSDAPNTKNRCGGNEKNRKDFYCDGANIESGYKCNPMAYGFNDNNKPICVPYKEKTKPAVYVSEQCKEANPIDNEESQKKFIDNILRNKIQLGLKDLPHFFRELKGHIIAASETCGLSAQSVESRLQKNPIPSYSDNDFDQAFPAVIAQGIDIKEGHRTACRHLMNRLVLAKKAAICSEELTLAEVSPDPDEQKAIEIQCPRLKIGANGKNSGEEDCKLTKDKAQSALNDLKVGNLKKDDNRIAQVNQDLSMLRQKNVTCAIAGWPPVIPEVVAPVTPLPGKEKEKNFCQRSKLHTFGCVAVPFFGLFMLLKKNKKSQSVASNVSVPDVPVIADPPPKTVGKTGEKQNDTSPSDTAPNKRPKSPAMGG